MINPAIGNYVYIVPTGDPNIDRFLNQQMTVIKIEMIWGDRSTLFPLYTLQSPDGLCVNVLDCEMEYHNA